MITQNRREKILIHTISLKTKWFHLENFDNGTGENVANQKQGIQLI